MKAKTNIIEILGISRGGNLGYRLVMCLVYEFPSIAVIEYNV